MRGRADARRRPDGGALASRHAPGRLSRPEGGPRGGRRGCARHDAPARPDRMGSRRKLLSARAAGRRARLERLRGAGAPRRLAGARRAADVPGRRNEPLGPGDHGRPPRGGRTRDARPRRGGRRAADPPPARRHRRAREPRAGALRPEDRAGSGLDRDVRRGRHPREQRERHVLRRRPERVSHARVAHVRPALRHDDRHGASRRRRRPARRRARAVAGPPRTQGARGGRRGPRRAHPGQVPDEEHDGLLAERVPRLHAPRRRVRAPPRRVGRERSRSSRRRSSGRFRTSPSSTRGFSSSRTSTPPAARSSRSTRRAPGRSS